MPQYLYWIRPARADFFSAPTQEDDLFIDEHFRYLEMWSKKGVVLLAGRTQNDDATTFGIVIFESANGQEARRFMEEDPAVRAGVFRAEVFAFRVALHAPGWETPPTHV